MYTITFENQVGNDLQKLSQNVRKEVQEYLKKLARDPMRYSQPLTRELRGTHKVYLSGAKYRIVFYIEENRMYIVVIAIGNRQDVYKIAAQRLGK